MKCRVRLIWPNGEVCIDLIASTSFKVSRGQGTPSLPKPEAEIGQTIHALPGPDFQKIVEAEMELWRSSGPTLLFKQGNLQPVVQ